MSSIVFGLCLGYGLAFALGKVNMSALNVEMLMSFNIPQPFKYGIDFNISSFIAIGLVYLITAIEATGDVTANSMISGLPIEGDSYLKRVSGGVMADGFNSLLAGIFNSFPNSIFAQNNGIIQLTGVASRYVGYYIAAMLVLLGLFPIVGAIFSLMPDPVLGGATLLMFGTVAAAGILTGNRPQRNPSLSSQPIFRFGCGTNAGRIKTSSRGDSKYFLFRNHHRRFNCNCC